MGCLNSAVIWLNKVGTWLYFMWRNLRNLRSKSTWTMTVTSFAVPTKQIVSPSDLHAFLHSDTYNLINDYIEDLSKAVEDTPIKSDIETSKVPGL